jgi:hypothetical protein
MDGRMGHAKAIGVIVGVCFGAALLLAIDFFFVLVLVYRAGWLNSLTSLIALSVAAVMLAVAQAYILARVLVARRPEQVHAAVDYCRANKAVAFGVVFVMLVVLRLVAGRFLG